MSPDTNTPASRSAVAPAAAKRLRVAFVPDFRNNPYQKLLADHLEAEGVETIFRNSIEEVARDHESGRVPVDVLHLHWLTAFKPRLGSLWSGFRQIRALKRLAARGVPLVWTAHNRIPHETRLPALDQRMSSKVAALADRIIVHSEAANREIALECGVTTDGKIKVIHHGNYHSVYGEELDKSSARAQLGLGEREFVFLFLGAIRPHKGVSDLIAAFRSSGLDATLVIAGNISDKEFEARLREEERQVPGIRLMSGFIPDEKIGVFLSSADLVVLPYQRSLTSGALILAMSFARACIVPDFDTFTEFIDERGGYQYTSGNIQELVVAMSQALADRDRLEEMGRRNRRLVDQWDWSGVARLTAGVYEEAMKVKSGKGR